MIEVIGALFDKRTADWSKNTAKIFEVVPHFILGINKYFEGRGEMTEFSVEWKNINLVEDKLIEVIGKAQPTIGSIVVYENNAVTITFDNQEEWCQVIMMKLPFEILLVEDSDYVCETIAQINVFETNEQYKNAPDDDMSEYENIIPTTSKVLH